MSGTAPDERQRSTAEWVAFAVSCLVLGAVVALISVDLLTGERGVKLSVEVTGSNPHGDEVHLSVRVENTGDEPVADVQVVAELTVGEETTEADLVVDFLAGGASEELVFVFPSDPAEGDLSLRVAAYRRP